MLVSKITTYIGLKGATRDAMHLSAKHRLGMKFDIGAESGRARDLTLAAQFYPRHGEYGAAVARWEIDPVRLVGVQ